MGKRANGEGTIYKHGEGRWAAELRWRDPQDGTRKRISLYGKTQTEVRRKLREARERLDNGAPVKDAPCTVGAWLVD